MTTQSKTAAQVLEHAAELLDKMAAELERAHTVNGSWPSDPDAEDRRASAAVSDMWDTARLLHDYANWMVPVGRALPGKMAQLLNVTEPTEGRTAATDRKPEPVIDDAQVILAMQKYGGHFVRSLAAAATFADSKNLQKIKAAWPDYWASYSEMATVKL